VSSAAVGGATCVTLHSLIKLQALQSRTSNCFCNSVDTTAIVVMRSCLHSCELSGQLMAVLSEALLYCKEGKLRMQALSAWLCFVQLLAEEAPQVRVTPL